MKRNVIIPLVVLLFVYNFAVLNIKNMKKKLFILLMAILSLSNMSINAQPVEVELGFKGDMNLSFVTLE